MPRLTTIKTNFSGGELSPRMLGSVDLPVYQNAVEIMENALPVVQGGVMRRGGTVYKNPAKSNVNNTRLIPFVVDNTSAYVLEMGDLYLRIFKNTGARMESPPGTPVEVVTPYAASIVFDLGYCQSSDTMIFFHQTLPPQRLRRFSDTLWVWDAAPIDPLPFDEIGDSFATTLTLSLATVGTGRTATAGAATFQNGDVGRTIAYQGGFATITAFTSSTIVTITINTAFQGTAIPSGVWTLGGTPQESITPSAKDPIGTVITLTAAALNTWRSSDVGKYVRIAGGLCKITAYTSALIVSARIVEVLSATVAQPALSWQLLAAVWSAQNGYPRCGTFFQQRLCAAGTPAQPQTVWGSTTGAYFDFTVGPLDDDAFQYTMASDTTNPILALAGTSVLLALTVSGEFTVKGGIEKPITPTNVAVDNDTSYGADGVRPVRFGKSIGFVGKGGRKFRAYSYDKNYDLADAPDVTFFSEHVSKDPAAATFGFSELAYMAEPDPIVWCKRRDGVLASLTIADNGDMKISAWARQFTGTAGYVRSVAVIPSASGDEAWMVVDRVISGVPVKYIEIYDTAMQTDCSLVLSSGSPTTVWGGLAHLEGQTVSAYFLNYDGSGTYYGDLVVSGGSITITNPTTTLRVGIPYNSRVKMLTPEVGTGTGSAQGNAMRTSEVTVRVKDTATLLCNGQEITARKFGAAFLDQVNPAVTGVRRLELLGIERGSSALEFTSSRPFPFHILSVVRKFTVND